MAKNFFGRESELLHVSWGGGSIFLLPLIQVAKNFFGRESEFDFDIFPKVGGCPLHYKGIDIGDVT